MLLAFLLMAPIALAQKTEVGVTYGTGALLTAHGSFRVAGGEACVRCDGRVAYFLEYSHWWLTPPGGLTSKLDMGSGGVRIQGKNKYVRPFVDIGITAGSYDGHPHDFVHKDENFDLEGVALGVGVTVSVTKHFYVRPQAKIADGLGSGVGFAVVVACYRF